MIDKERSAAIREAVFVATSNEVSRKDVLFDVFSSLVVYDHMQKAHVELDGVIISMQKKSPPTPPGK